MSKRPILVFDVNETLLDIESLCPLFDRMFGDPCVMREWFAQVILYSQSLTLTADYADFGALAAAVLKMLGQMKQVEIRSRDLLDLKAAMAHLPPHEDIPQELARLKQAGFREIFAPWILPVLMLGAMLGLIQQVTGINTIIY